VSARPRWQRKPASAGYGTARAWDIDRVRALGAEPVVEADRVGLQLAPQSVHAVIDTIGGDALESACNVLRPNGVIVSVVRAPDETYLRSKGVPRGVFHGRRYPGPARPPLYERKLRLPDFAQCTPTADAFLQPDFYYRRGAIPSICVFIDGPHHTAHEREDRRAREVLQDQGYRMITIGPGRPLREQIDAYPDVFAPAASGH
jgi:hypothetical protein